MYQLKAMRRILNEFKAGRGEKIVVTTLLARKNISYSEPTGPPPEHDYRDIAFPPSFWHDQRQLPA